MSDFNSGTSARNIYLCDCVNLASYPGLLAPSSTHACFVHVNYLLVVVSEGEGLEDFIM